jgi:hypothetical protein
VSTHLLDRARHVARAAIDALRRRLLRWTEPATAGSLTLGVVADLERSRSELVAENALLRHQLIVLARTAKRPRFSRTDRPLRVLMASRVPTWRQALLIDQPASLLRWHREGFRLVWRWRSAPRRRLEGTPPKTIALTLAGASGIEVIRGIGQRTRVATDSVVPRSQERKRVIATPVLGGLHHEYRLVA